VEAPGRIQILPDVVVDQIAAGEVVERPASVVKELVENALDAGARTVSVEVAGGGRQLIRVVDDGCGMSPRDARLALARHATSKLRGVEDLWELATMGFRGEALPSIASVSRMILTTRAADAEVATRLVVEAGRVIEEGEIGAPIGTTIEVRDLLANQPARLKFLRGEATESSHVTEALSRLAMAHPDVHIKLSIRPSGKPSGGQGRVALDAPPAPTVLERARQLLGPRLASRLHEARGEEAGVRVTALLAAPELAQTTARGVQLYVGRRAVRDRGLLHALAMGYGELVPRGRYPVAIVFVDAPAGAVDVNVHPQKLEVRFADAQAVTAAVRHVVRKGVAGAPWLGEAAGSAPVSVRAVASYAPPRWDASAGGAAEETRVRVAESQRALDLDPARPPVTLPPQQGGWTERMKASIAARAAIASRTARAPAPAASAAEVVRADDAPRPTFFSQLRYLGQLDRTYLVCEADGELVLIDQHAAHERVEFQRLRERSESREIAVQRLLFPTTVEVGAEAVAAAAEASDVLAAAGFEVEPFGGTSVAIKAAPAGLRHDDPADVLRELLGELSELDGSRAVESHLDHVLATIACHSVVRAGDVLAPHEAEALLRSMDGVDFRANCPHGRPVLLRMSVADLARRFGR
jgi:DNA mismatch repair protein MutL